MSEQPFIIDGLQYCNWSEKIFRQMNQAGVAATHVTISYHEDFRETVGNMIAWNRRFKRFPDLITRASSAADILRAHKNNQTAIVFGFQNCVHLCAVFVLRLFEHLISSDNLSKVFKKYCISALANYRSITSTILKTRDCFSFFIVRATFWLYIFRMHPLM